LVKGNRPADYLRCPGCGAPGIFFDKCDYCRKELCPNCMVDGCCGHFPAVSYWTVLAEEIEMYGLKGEREREDSVRG